MLASRCCRASTSTLTRINVLDFLAPRFIGQVHYAPTSRRRRATSTARRQNSTQQATVSQARPSSIFETVLNADDKLVSSSLSQINYACRARDVLGVWKVYRSLESQGLLNIIGLQFREQISRMLIVKCKSSAKVSKWDKEELSAIQDLALFAASSGLSEVVRQFMLRCLREGDADGALEIYARYCQQLSSKEEILNSMEKEESSTASDQDDSLEGGFDIGLEGSISEKRYASSVVNPSLVKATAIIAYALKNSFHEALHSSLQQSHTRVLPQHIRTVLHEVKTCNDVEVLSCNYVEALSAASLACRTTSLKAHVLHLVDQRRVVRIQQLSESMLAGFSGPLQWAALDEANVSYTRPVVVSDRVWSYLLRAFIAIQKDDLAEDLWRKIAETTGSRPGIVMWNALLEGYRETGQLEMLTSTWQAMRGNGVQPDSNSYASRIICLFEHRKRSLALETFEEFKKRKLEDKDPLHVYNAVLNGLLHQDDGINQATAILNEMSASGPKPDIVSFNIFLKFYGKKGDMAKVVSVLSQLTKSGVLPDVVTFTTILSTMLKAGVADAAERLEQIMKTMGVELNVATYSAIIDAQVREGTYAGIQTAWELLQKMESNASAQPNEITYTSFLAGVHRSKELSGEQIMGIASEISKKMDKRGVRTRRGAYHILMKACLENPSPDGLNHFMWYFNTMRKKHMAFSHDTWYVILKGLLRRDEWALASEMVDVMLSSNFTPMWGVKDMMIRILTWRARNKVP